MYLQINYVILQTKYSSLQFPILIRFTFQKILILVYLFRKLIASGFVHFYLKRQTLSSKQIALSNIGFPICNQYLPLSLSSKKADHCHCHFNNVCTNKEDCRKVATDVSLGTSSPALPSAKSALSGPPKALKHYSHPQHTHLNARPALKLTACITQH